MTKVTKSPKYLKSYVLSIVIGVLILTSLFGVQRIWTIERCLECGCEKDIVSVRLATLDLSHETTEHTSIKQQVREDLGVACVHGALARWTKQRWLGIMFPVYRDRRGIVRLVSNDSWYNSRLRSKVASLTRQEKNDLWALISMIPYETSIRKEIEEGVLLIE